MATDDRSQARRGSGWKDRAGSGPALIVPNRKLKLLDQVREVMRLNLQKPWGFTDLAEIMGAMLGSGNPKAEIRGPRGDTDCTDFHGGGGGGEMLRC